MHYLFSKLGKKRKEQRDGGRERDGKSRRKKRENRKEGKKDMEETANFFIYQ